MQSIGIEKQLIKHGSQWKKMQIYVKFWPQLYIFNVTAGKMCQKDKDNNNV